MFLYEVGFLFVGTFAGLLLADAQAWLLCIEVLAITWTWGLWVLLFRNHEGMLRVRMILTYGWLLWFYQAIQRIVPAARLPMYDTALLELDEQILGDTPSVAMSVFADPGYTEILSACYLFYLVYLHLALLDGVIGPLDRMVRLARVVFLAYVPGLCGYLLVPAKGPMSILPPLFAHPLPGGWVTELNSHFVASASSVYDVFPSLHVLITLALLTYDSCYNWLRFWLVLLPSVGITISTIYLRYHYGVDLVASLGCWIGLLAIWRLQGLIQ